MARLRVLFAVSECVPLAKTGGLGDVAGALPLALHRRGHDVRVVMPRYKSTKRFPAVRHPAPYGVPTGQGEKWVAVYETRLEDAVPVYLLEHDALYDRDGVYGDQTGEFGDNLLRFTVLSRAALGLPAYLGIGVDVIHAHDWPTALVPVLGRALGLTTPTVLTIHNLGYQGRYAQSQLAVVGLWPDQLHRLGLEFWNDLCLLKGGIVCASKITAVSRRYAAEIQTPAGGFGLDGVLRDRAADVVGILNGIDDVEWDPRSDPHLPARFGPGDLAGKAVCKAALQRELGLEPREHVPLVGLVTRLAHQKGIDVVAAALPALLELDLQIVVLGAGDPQLEAVFARTSEIAPHFRARFGLDERLAHAIVAGTDLFLMPSRYEPCGLTQMYSQRYGTLPIVRAVGGLVDTVEHELTGFVFQELSPRSLTAAVAWAVDCHRDRPEHFRAMQRTSMQKRMGWDQAAAQYEALYRLALRRGSTRSAGRALRSDRR
jgi:starch synthase